MLTIPAALLNLFGVRVGAVVAPSVIDGKLIAKPVDATGRRYSLNELLEGSESVAALNAATAWARGGEPVGREIG